jgi:polygalacturonase
VTYKNITLSNITTYGIDVQQDYLNGGPTGKPTNGVQVSNLTFIDVVGNVADKALEFYILCGNSSCSNFSFSGVKLTGGSVGSCNYPSSTCP